MSMIHDTHSHFPKMTFQNLLGTFYVFQYILSKTFLLLAIKDEEKEKEKVEEKVTAVDVACK